MDIVCEEQEQHHHIQQTSVERVEDEDIYEDDGKIPVQLNYRPAQQISAIELEQCFFVNQHMLDVQFIVF